MDHLIEVSLAGLTLPCALRYAEAAAFPPPDPAAPRVGIDPVRLTEEDWDYYIRQGSEASPQSEYSLLTAAFSDALMDFDRLVIHGAALRWQDRAWMICGPSGVGKSTQTGWLRRLRPGEFGVISGDRPVLEFRQPDPVAAHSVRHLPAPVGADAHVGPSASPAQSLPLEGKVSPKATDEVVLRRASNVAAPVGRPDPRPPSPVGADAHVGPSAILVHPSPWNGKEDWHDAEAAPLAGIVLLRRGEENRLEALDPREAAVPVYAQVIQTAVRADRLHRSAELVTALVQTVPVWRLTTHQPPASTELLLNEIFKP